MDPKNRTMNFDTVKPIKYYDSEEFGAVVKQLYGENEHINAQKVYELLRST